jgi:multicomponent Na+:H+ antiporter subunit G
MIMREVCSFFALFVGVAIVILCCVGLLRGDVYARLHFIGPASVLAPWLIAAALALQFSFSQTVIKAGMLAFIMTLTAPVLTHATAKAVHRMPPKGAAADTEDESE